MKKLILIVAAFVAVSTNAIAQLGSASSDLVYTPVTPCRIFDTRQSQGGTGSIAAAGTKNFVVWGQTSYAAQGGKNTNCGITAGSDTAAVAINVTVVTPAAGGFVTAYPFGAQLPTAATVNFQAGDIARGNFTIAKVNQAAASADLSVYSSSLVDVVGDVVGYYSKPAATALQCVNSALKFTSIPANSSLSVSANACPTGYSALAATCDSTSTALFILGSGTGGDTNGVTGAFCKFINTSGASQNSYTAATCCRIPGR
jgi:hypothetical protein